MMEEKFNVYIPKYYKYTVFDDFCYKRKRIDYKESILDRKATEETQNFIKNCDCDYKILSKEQIENLFTKGFILVRITSTESILRYREHVVRGFNLMFMKSKEYQNLRKQLTEVIK